MHNSIAMEEIEESEQDRASGKETLAKSLLRYLDTAELTEVNKSGVLNSFAVLDCFSPVFIAGFLKTQDAEQVYCSCGVSILHMYFIIHKKTAVEIVVGSKCILRFDSGLREAIHLTRREEEIKKNPSAFCLYCKKRNQNGNHNSCTLEAQKNKLFLLAYKKPHNGYGDYRWYFEVDFQFKDAVKSLKAKWDATRRHWFTDNWKVALEVCNLKTDPKIKLVVEGLDG